MRSIEILRFLDADLFLFLFILIWFGISWSGHITGGQPVPEPYGVMLEWAPRKRHGWVVGPTWKHRVGIGWQIMRA